MLLLFIPMTMNYEKGHKSTNLLKNISIIFIIRNNVSLPTKNLNFNAFILTWVLNFLKNIWKEIKIVSNEDISKYTKIGKLFKNVLGTHNFNSIIYYSFNYFK